MDDESNIWFIYAHAKRNGRYHNLGIQEYNRNFHYCVLVHKKYSLENLHTVLLTFLLRVLALKKPIILIHGI